MNIKHRRLFRQNNRIAIDFYLLSADLNKNLYVSAKIWPIHFIFGAALCLFASNSLAESTEQEIDQYILTTIVEHYPDTEKNDIDYSANYPSMTLEQKTCESSLNFDWRGELSAGANTLNAQCDKPSWQVYIPVTVKIFKNVIVAAQPLSRNKPINTNQLATTRVDIGTLRMGYFTKAETLEGYELQRTVKPGQVITPYIAKAPPLVKRGDWVTIISGRSGLTVTSTGEAMKNGVMGDQIPVKNLKSEETIRAWIIKKGVVSTKKELL